MKIDLKYNYSQLQSLNTTWEYMEHLTPVDAKQRAMKSAIMELAVKFKKKELEIFYKRTLNNNFKTSLKEYQAYFLETFLRDLLKSKDLPLDYNRMVIYSMANDLNQKLA